MQTAYFLKNQQKPTEATSSFCFNGLMGIRLKTFIANNYKTGCKLCKTTVSCHCRVDGTWLGFLRTKKTYELSSIFILALCLGDSPH